MGPCGVANERGRKAAVVQAGRGIFGRWDAPRGPRPSAPARLPTGLHERGLNIISSLLLRAIRASLNLQVVRIRAPRGFSEVVRVDVALPTMTSKSIADCIAIRRVSKCPMTEF